MAGFNAKLQAQFSRVLVKVEPKIAHAISARIPSGTILHCLDSGFGLYQIQVPAERISQEFLRTLNSITGVQAVQQSRTVTRRNNPNDPLFAAQNYLNTIHAPQFWARNTGGVNRRGDTLVVALIDDGMDTMHPDLRLNMWFNRNEISWNGIDDDANGYVDDYRGWNGGDSNNRTFTTQSLYAHGTEVAGIVGAAGNNAKGISGINWQVKLMPLLCYPLNGVDGDLGVIRSMLYALRMKQLYMKTGGQKGACIMAVNMSVGIDGAFPNEEPIWCSMYDSLGNAGIISSLATTNSNVDVGVAGDIPSLCPSPFTIVVNNTDASDNRINSGFSSEHVDMAAPGQGAYTTQLSTYSGPNGPYASVSGTSFAAPQVGAAVALLCAEVCDSFWTLHKNLPDSAARLLRGWILRSVDVIPALSGKCASSGRLNIEKARTEMNLWCTAVNQNLKNQIVIYPNPAAPGQVVIWNGIMPGLATVSLHSMDGRQVAASLTSEGNTISLPYVSPGFYLLQGKSATGVVRTRIFISELPR
ncbi:MAG: hypothetical protein RLZZ161_1821 [Bacteroidota bacterium]